MSSRIGVGISRPARLALLMLAATGSAGPVHSDEGMWLADQISAADGNGPRIPALPLGAVTALGSCTASFVSEIGLLLTNHHCLSGSVQYNSNPRRDYLRDGFVARERRDELPAAPGTRIHVIEEWRDITDQLQARTEGLAKSEQDRLVGDRRKALLAECEKLAGRRCHIRSYWGGTRHYFERRLELQDIRLVYAPAAGLGAFGGDSDNWNWPRHTGDFGFYRAYVAPDGSPAPYSPRNIPYRPPAVLKISSEGAAAGDPIWTAGFPVVTSRHVTAAETIFNLTQYEPAWLALLEDYEVQILAATADDAEKQLRYATIIDNTRNYRKKLIGSLGGARAAKVAERKRAFEEALRRSGDGDQGDGSVASSLNALDAAATERDALRLNSLRRSILERGQLLQAARTLYRWAKEREKPDVDRAAGFRDGDRQLVADRLRRIQSRFVASVDRTLLEAALHDYHKLPAEERSRAFEERLETLGIEQIYARTKLGDMNARLAWLDRPASAFSRSNDPFIQLAVALSADEEAREGKARALNKRTQVARDAYLAALAQYRRKTGAPVYPDADGTLRISSGRIEGRVRDGETWDPFTSQSGLIEKQRGEGDFDAPPRLIAALSGGKFGSYGAPEDGRLPVNFLSSADITNGNSGSPTLNARGEVVGLVFDGTMDGVISDWFYVADRNRTIHVDIRFLLWVIEKVDNAGHLVREMKIAR